MIEKLEKKFVIIVMSIVTIILLAIFLTMLFSTQRNSEKTSMNILNQVLSFQPIIEVERRESAKRTTNNPPILRAASSRQPVLIMNVDNNKVISIISNQLHFLNDADALSLAELVLEKNKESGVVEGNDLRYLRITNRNGSKIAFIDISQEREMMRTQIIISLVIGGIALIVFFVISIFLSKWAVRPVETAWKKQKQFIANASHELKTPLTVILSNADIIKKENLLVDENDVTRIDHIHAESLRMKKLVEDMLTLAKHDSSQLVDSFEEVDFSDILKSSTLVYEPIFYDCNKKLSYVIEKDLFVQGDKIRLNQVTHILLDNANKYSSADGVIQVSLKIDDPQSLLLTVTNTGTPIPQSELENIFSRFYRMDEARASDESFGLGLSIAESIVSEHGGKIWAKSDGENQNQFFVSLPIVAKNNN